MNSAPILYQPNRQLERSLIPEEVLPVSSYDCSFFIDINEQEEFIIGHSNISGAFWRSILYHYKENSALFNKQHVGYYIGSSTTGDAKFISNTNVALAEDTGCLKVLLLSDTGDSNVLCEEVFRTQRIEQLATWYDGHKVVACADRSILIGDVQNDAPLDEYRNYHTDLVTSVDTNRKNTHLFASASMDGKACVWDDRTKTTPLLLYQNEFNGLTSVGWNPVKSERLIVGSEGGNIYELDMRQPTEFVDSRNCFAAAIHRSAFNSSGYLAVCGNSPQVLILNSKDFYKTVYDSKQQHSKFVRGLAWSKDTLYTCGFDKNVVKHVF